MMVPGKIRPEEVFLLLRKWNDESTPLRAFFSLGGFGADFDCRVIMLSGTLVSLRLDGLTISSWFELENCSFEYGEPPRSSVEQHSLNGRRYVSALIVKSLSSGWTVALMELSEENQS
jgi:hypothetical protein